MSFRTTRTKGTKEGTSGLEIIIPDPNEAVGANATPELDITNPGTTPKLFSVVIDCTQNPGEDVTLRLYDKISSLSVGTDNAHVWLPGKRGESKEFEFVIGIPFALGTSAAVVQGAGGTAGASNPTGFVKVTLRMEE